MEDKEFELEQNKFTFERARHINDMRFQTVITLYRQLFTFNIGILTLIFFVIYQSLEYNICKFLYALPVIAVILSTISIVFLVGVYVNSDKNLKLEINAVFNGYPNKDTIDEHAKRRMQNERNANGSYYLCVGSWSIVLVAIFVAIFTVDFTKQKDDKINKVQIINCGMANTNQNTQSAKQPIIETKSLELSEHSAFSMATLGQSKPQPESFSQKPQPTSTTKQPSNKQ